MTTQEIKSHKVPLCKKCGSLMITRMLAVRNTKAAKLIKIHQCSLCRHWESIE